MENKLICYCSNNENHRLPQEPCEKYMQIKQWIREYLSVSEEHGICISSYHDEQFHETVFMIECINHRKMNIFKTQKSLSEINREDIPSILQTPYICRPSDVTIKF
jgi:hypothetical protein